MPEKNLKILTTIIGLDFGLKKNIDRETQPFSRNSVLEYFPSRRKQKAGVLKFLRFVPDGLVWTVGLTV